MRNPQSALRHGSVSSRHISQIPNLGSDPRLRRGCRHRFPSGTMRPSGQPRTASERQNPKHRSNPSHSISETGREIRSNEAPTSPLHYALPIAQSRPRRRPEGAPPAGAVRPRLGGFRSNQIGVRRRFGAVRGGGSGAVEERSGGGNRPAGLRFGRRRRGDSVG